MGCDQDNKKAIECGDKGQCPTPAAHTRLWDAHRLWHQCLNEYSDPDGFRINLNSCIQALRSVTFVLQKQKSRIPDFDSWYPAWQDKLRADPILKWLVEARNLIVKVGDLETRSTVRVAVVSNYFEPPYAEINVHPLTPTDDIAGEIASQVPKILRSHSILRVERRWVASDLPRNELLDALAHAYGVLSTLVDDAHAQAGVPGIMVCLETADGAVKQPKMSLDHLKGRLPCMITTEEARTVWIKLSTGEFIRPVSTNAPIIPKKEVIARYGFSDKLFPKEKPKSIREMAEFFFEQGKQILRVDGYHLPIVTLVLPNRGVSIMCLRPEDTSEKFLMWSNVAAEVRRNGSKTIIAISEAWEAPIDPKFPNRPASESPERYEVLALDAASSDGKEFSLRCRFRRKDGSIEFENTHESSDQKAFFLEPIRRVWGTEKHHIERRRRLEKYEIGRNQPCPCGSGKKFKKCCAPTLQMNLRSKAKELYDQKEYEKAEIAFRSYLTQYIIWYHEHTVPFVKDDPIAADEILMVDINAIMSLLVSIVSCLHHQNKNQEIELFLQKSYDIIDDERYRSNIKELRESLSVALDQNVIH